MFKVKFKNGFTLAEVLISMVVMSMIALIISTIVIPVMRNSSVHKTLYQSQSERKNSLDSEILEAIKMSERFNKSGATSDAPKILYQNIFGVAQISGYTENVGNLCTIVSSGYKELPIPTATEQKIIIKGSAIDASPFIYLYSASNYTLEGSTIRSSGINIPYGIYGIFYRSSKDADGNLLKPMTTEEVIPLNPRFKNNYVLLPGNNKNLKLMNYINPNDKTKIKADDNLSPEQKTVKYDYEITTSMDFEDRNLMFSAIPLGTNTYMGAEIPARIPLYMIGLPVVGNLVSHYDAALILQKNPDKTYTEDPNLQVNPLQWKDARKYIANSGGSDFIFNFQNMMLHYTDYGKVARIPKASFIAIGNTLFGIGGSGLPVNRSIFIRLNTGIKPATGSNNANYNILSKGDWSVTSPSSDSFRIYVDETAQKLILERIIPVSAKKPGFSTIYTTRREVYQMDLKKPYTNLNSTQDNTRKDFEILRIDMAAKDLKISLLGNELESGKIKLNSNSDFNFVTSNYVGTTPPAGYTVLPSISTNLSIFSFGTDIATNNDTGYRMGGIVGNNTNGSVDISDMVFYNENLLPFNSSDYSMDVSAYLFRKYLTEEEFEKKYK